MLAKFSPSTVFLQRHAAEVEAATPDGKLSEYEAPLSFLPERTKSPTPRVEIDVGRWRTLIDMGLITRKIEDLPVSHAFSELERLEEEKDKQLQNRASLGNNFPELGDEDEEFVRLPLLLEFPPAFRFRPVSFLFSSFPG